MKKNIYIMKNKRIGSLTGSFESDEEIAKAQKIIDKKRSMYESEQVKIWKEFGINKEKWDLKYKLNKEEKKKKIIAKANKEIEKFEKLIN